MSAGQKIDLNYARQLVKNYADNKLGKTLLANDTQAIWFSKEILLESLGLPPDTVTNEVTGVRFYFGAYEDKSGYPENAADYKKLTLVAVTTGDQSINVDHGGKAETAWMDIIIEPQAGGKTQPSYPTGVPTDRNQIYNEGQPYPPPSTAAGLGLMDW